MRHSGFTWSIQPQGDRWAWRAEGRDDGAVIAEGHANSRPEAAAYLARIMALAVLPGLTATS